MIRDPVATLVNVLRFTLQVASIPRLITYMWQTDADLQLFGIKHLRQILYLGKTLVDLNLFYNLLQVNDYNLDMSTEPCPVEEIISSEIVPRFVEFLHLNDHQELQVWIKVIAFFHLMLCFAYNSSLNILLQFEAVSCFAIISSERPKVIDLYNILPVLVSLVSSPCAKISNEVHLL